MGASKRSSDTELILAALEPMRPAMERVYDAIKARPNTTNGIASMTGISVTHVRSNLSKLVACGRIQECIAVRAVAGIRRGARVFAVR